MVGVWNGGHRLKLKWAQVYLAEQTVLEVQQERVKWKIISGARDPQCDPGNRVQGTGGKFLHSRTHSVVTLGSLGIWFLRVKKFFFHSKIMAQYYMKLHLEKWEL